MTTILFTHPSADLYGSDRTLLQIVTATAEREGWHAIVALPRRGVLAERLEAVGATVEIGELGAAMRADLSPGRLPKLLSKARTGSRFVESLVERYDVDLVHTNTSVLIGAAIGANRSKATHVWHVHEILDEPAWAGKVMRTVIKRWADVAVVNSRATGRAMTDRRMRSVEVVHNGVQSTDYAIPAGRRAEMRASLGVRENEKLVVLPGRINSWKGQRLLLDAIDEMGAAAKGVRVVFAGDAPEGQEHFSDALDVRIKRGHYADRVQRLDFTEDMPALLAAADVCVVPSTRPEPFGLVAIEAMAAGTPVVAAGHGGVCEVIEDGVTGRLFEPRSKSSLAKVLGSLLANDIERHRLADAARARQIELFTVARYRSRLLGIYGDLVAERPMRPDVQKLAA